MPLIRRSTTVNKGRFRQPQRIISSPVKQSRGIRRSIGTPRKTPARPGVPTSTSAATHVKVAVRVRPRNSTESLGDVVKPFANHVLFDPDEDGDNNTFFYNGKRQLLPSAARKKHQNITYTFDSVFDDNSTNTDVFAETISNDVLGAVMGGFNASVFAYGATGAGKTHTMVGNKHDPGITYRTVEELFRRARESSTGAVVEFQVSYLEVYNENVYDLLVASREALPLLDDGKSVTVKNLTWHVPNSPGELLHLLAEGNKNRAQSETLANKDSSRSHAVFTIQVSQRIIKVDGDLPEKRLSKLMLVDLAGSERASATGHAAARFKEGTNINKSLLALGKCINDLVEGKSHINYRGSKLTRILKDCLGGNCRTVMLAAVSPTSSQFSDTKNTLEYASRARKISVNLKQNVRRVANSTADCLKLLGEVQAQLATSMKEVSEWRKRAEEAEEKVRQQTVFRVPARPVQIVDLETDDLIGRLETIVEEQRELDAELQSVQDQKAVDHFRLLRSQYLEADMECLRSLNSDGRDMMPDFARIQSQVQTHHARMEEKEAQLRKVMGRNALKIEELVQEAREAGTDDRQALAAEALRAKLEATSCRATLLHFKNLLTEAEREIDHQRSVNRASLPILKRSCLLVQRHGRDPVIDSSVKRLQAIVGRRDGVHFSEEDSENPRPMFLPPTVICPAVVEQNEHLEEIKENKNVKPKEKWVKVDIKEDEDEEEDAEPMTPVKSWSKVMSSTPYSVHRPPTTPGGTSIVDYALSDEEDAGDDAAKDVEKTWVKDEVENCNPVTGLKGVPSKPPQNRQQQPLRQRLPSGVGPRPYAPPGAPPQHPSSTRMVQPRFAPVRKN